MSHVRYFGLLDLLLGTVDEGFGCQDCLRLRLPLGHGAL